MAKKDVEKAKKIMKRFDPQLVVMTLQEIDVSKANVDKAKTGISKTYDSVKAKTPQEKMQVLSHAMAEINMEVMEKEMENVKASLKNFDKETLEVAAREAFEIDEKFCIFPVCTCPEGGCGFYGICIFPEGPGCGRYPVCIFPEGPICRRYPVCIFCLPRIWWSGDYSTPQLVQPIEPAIDLEHIGLTITQAIRKLNEVDRGNIVISDGTRFGSQEYCVDSVKCTGRQIWVMSKCTSALFTFDQNGVIDPIDAIQKIASTDPTLKRRVNKMLDAMKKAGEL